MPPNDPSVLSFFSHVWCHYNFLNYTTKSHAIMTQCQRNGKLLLLQFKPLSVKSKKWSRQQEARGPWRPAWRFARWNQRSFMDTGNVAEVTYLQSAIYFKIWQIAKKSNSLYSPLIAMLSIKFGWNWMKTVGTIAFWKYAKNLSPHPTPPPITMLSIKFGWNWMKTVGAVALWIS